MRSGRYGDSHSGGAGGKIGEVQIIKFPSHPARVRDYMPRWHDGHLAYTTAQMDGWSPAMKQVVKEVCIHQPDVDIWIVPT